MFLFRKTLIVIFLILISSVSCGGGRSPLTIAVKSGTTFPAFVVTGSTTTAYFTVTNNINHAYSSVNIQSLPANVTQVTSDGTYSDTCGSPATLTALGSCTLQLTISGAVSNSASIVGCLNRNISCMRALTPNAIRELSSIAISPTMIEGSINDTQQLTATGTFADETTDDISTYVTWTSSNTDALTVSDAGVATLIANGIGNVTASYDTLESNEVSFNIGNLQLSDLHITPTYTNAQISDETIQFTATALYTDESSTDVTSNVTWESSDESVATISSDGLLTILTSGSITITATLDGTTSNMATLIVDPQ